MNANVSISTSAAAEGVALHPVELQKYLVRTQRSLQLLKRLRSLLQV